METAALFFCGRVGAGKLRCWGLGHMSANDDALTPVSFLSCLLCKIEALKSFSKSDLVSWFKAHRGPESKMLSVHVSTANHLESLTPSWQLITPVFAFSRLLDMGSMNWKRMAPLFVRTSILVKGCSWPTCHPLLSWQTLPSPLLISGPSHQHLASSPTTK